MRPLAFYIAEVIRLAAVVVMVSAVAKVTGFWP